MLNQNDNLAPRLWLAGVLVILLAIFWQEPVQAPQEAPASLSFPKIAEAPPITTIITAGDILLSRHVGAKIDERQNPNLPFEQVKSLLSGADLAIGNLECPFSQKEQPIREGLIFRCLAKYLPGLKFAGFDMLSLANNHAMDQGLADQLFTKKNLSENGILATGTGANLEEAWEPAITEINGVKIALLAASYASNNDGGKNFNDYVARIEQKSYLQKALNDLKSKADFIIVSMHAGEEYTRKPNEAQINFARAAIEGGADAVIGHHPHWIQPVEIYCPNTPSPLQEEDEASALSSAERGERQGCGLIFYSLGNFVFDQEWSRETKEGLVAKLILKDKKLEEAELMPIVIENYCCPRLAREDEMQNILQKIGLQSPVLKLAR